MQNKKTEPLLLELRLLARPMIWTVNSTWLTWRNPCKRGRLTFSRWSSKVILITNFWDSIGPHISTPMGIQSESFSLTMFKFCCSFWVPGRLLFSYLESTQFAPHFQIYVRSILGTYCYC